MAEVAGLTRAEAREEDAEETALRRMIDSERAALDRSLDRLNDRFRDTVDWRQYASRHRGALAAAASGAVLLGAWRWARRRRSRPERAAEVLVEGVREVAAQTIDTLATLGSLVSVKRRMPKVVLAPLAGAAARAAIKWWDDRRDGGGDRPERERTHEEEAWRLEKRMP
jgi:hypothetical protein